MIVQRRLLGLSFCCLLSLSVFAAAPVIDDSENFAMLDEQPAAPERPVMDDEYDDNPDQQVALAHDNAPDRSENADLVNKLRGMQQDIQELRGQLEVQSHELKQLQQQQLAFYKDVDNRLVGTSGAKPAATQPTELSLSNAPSAPRAVTPAPIPASTSAYHANPADEQISYLAAYELVKNKRYDEALVAMQNFVTKYPQGGYTANAQYWLGELYMVKKDYPQAINHFETVLQQFPTSSKAAACSLKIGYALAASGKEQEAKQRLQDVLKNYPDTPTAELAATKLRSLNAL